jgi:MFS family permease
MLRVQVPRDGRMRRVLVAFGLFALVEFATWIAILLVAYDRGGAAMVGIASVAMLVPAIVLVPVLSGFGDRMSRGRALAVSHAGVGFSAALTGVLLLVGAPWWSVLCAGALLTVIVGFVRPMHFAALPGLAVRPGDLVAANGLSSSVEGMAVFLGFLLGGVLTDRVGASGALFVGTLLAFSAAGLTSGLRTSGARRTVVRDGGLHAWHGALEGFVALRGGWGAQALLLLFAITFLVMGANDTLTVTFNSEVLGLDDSAAGLLAGAYGLGLAIGGITQTGLAHRRRLAPVVLAGALLLGLAELAVAFLGSLAPAFVMLVLVGVGVSLVLVSSRTLLQRGMDRMVLARVLAVQEGVHLMGLTLGAMAGPIAVFVLGPQLAFLPFGIFVITVGLLSFPAIRSMDVSAPLHLREVELLSKVPFLATLPAYELEHLAQTAHWESLPATAEAVTQGALGDSYYIVAAGELSVTVDGVLREHTLTAGDGFGEISLLHRVPRTATITALTDSELLVIGAAQFLASVASSADGGALAAEVSVAHLEADGGVADS